MPWKAIYNMKAVRKNFNIKMEYDILLPYNLGQPKFSGQVILKTLRPCQYTKVCIMFPLVFTTKKQLQKYWIKTPTIELRFLFQVKQLCTWWNKKQLSQLRNCDGMISLYLKFLQASLRRLKVLRLPKVCTFFLFFFWFSTSMIVEYWGINDKSWTNRRPWVILKSWALQYLSQGLPAHFICKRSKD